MASNQLKSLNAADAEVTYAKAAKAELTRDYDQAFRLYIKAAEAFLHASRANAAGERERAAAKASAGKALERAEKLKAFVSKNKTTLDSADAHAQSSVGSGAHALTPVAVNPFSQQEQRYVLKKGELINGLRFPLWNESKPAAIPQNRSQRSGLSKLTYEDPDGQPTLSPEQIRFSPIWRPPAVTSPTAGSSTSSDEDSADSRSQEARVRSLLPQDILQHVVPDCSVCASISVSLEHQRRFGTVVVKSAIQSTPHAAGRYDVRFHFNGDWRRVLIDNKLPYHPVEGNLICMSTASSTPSGRDDEQESKIWPSLLEKAYMKLMGGYDFPGSNSSTDLHVLAGWIPEHIEITSPHFEREKSWQRIVDGFATGRCVLTLGTGRDKGSGIYWKDVELVPSHSYAVIDIQTDEESRIVTVLDTWLPYDSSGISEERKAQKSRVLEIPWSDVVNVFDGIYMSWDPKYWESVVKLHGMWKIKSDEQLNSRNIRLNFQLDAADKENEIWILLTRHVLDIRRSSEYISLRVQVEDDREAGQGYDSVNEVTNKGSYTNSSHILVCTRIPPFQRCGTLSIFASYDGQLPEVGFTLTAYARRSTALAWDESVPAAPFIAKVDGAFTSKNAGGNCAHPTFMLNPQYHLRIYPDRAAGSRPGAKARAMLALQGDRAVPLNITVVWSQGERVIELVQKEIAAHSGAYSHGLARVTKELPVGDYTVILSAFEPHHTGPFLLKVENSHRFDLTPIPQEGAGMYAKVIRGEWDAQTAAGSPGFNNYTQNPMYELTFPAPAQIKIRLQLTRPAPGTALNLTLFAPGTSTGASLGRRVATSGGYDGAVSGVALAQTALPAGRYVVVPSTYSPGVRAAWRMSVYSSGAGMGVREVGRG